MTGSRQLLPHGATGGWGSGGLCWGHRGVRDHSRRGGGKRRRLGHREDLEFMVLDEPSHNNIKVLNLICKRFFN